MKIKLSPSLERADLLNLESEIRQIEEAGCSYIHFDVMEPRMGGSTKLSPDMLGPIREKFSITIDTHLLTPQPNCLLDAVLPHVEGGNYITIYPEETYDTSAILKKIRNAGGKTGLSLYPASSLSYLEEILDYVDIVTLLIRDGGLDKELHAGILNKISRVRKMLDEAGRQDVDVAVDGSLTYDDVDPVIKAGANVLILGRKTAFIPGHTTRENLEALKKYIRELGYQLDKE